MPNSPAPEEAQPRNEILRDVLIFQVKLWLEGFKDIVLMPLSLGAAAIDLFVRRPQDQGVLYSVMKLGDRFERWVHLYAALEERDQASAPEQSPIDRYESLDDMLNEAADGIEENVTEDRTQSR